MMMFKVDLFPSLFKPSKDKCKTSEPSRIFLFTKNESISKSAVSIAYDSEPMRNIFANIVFTG